MPFAKEIMGGGFSPGQARAIGGTTNTALAATGSTQTDAALVTAGQTIVTGADGTKGVILPAAEVGDFVVLINNSASALKVYPPTGAAINVPGTSLGAANTAYSHTTFAGCIYRCFNSTQWVVLKGS